MHQRIHSGRSGSSRGQPDGRLLAPVREFNGRIVAAVNITAAKTRLGDRLDAAGRFVANAAQQLTKRLAVE